ncbi:hypothetical protein LIER_38564 [Lithospermum erythrorhizon]
MKQKEWCEICKRPYSQENYPRKNRTYFKCGKRGHLGNSCMSGPRGSATRCFKCGRSHDPRNCPMVNRNCFECGQLGHRAAMCPRKGTHGMRGVPNAQNKGPSYLSQGQQDN